MVSFHLRPRRRTWMRRSERARLRLTMHAIFPLRPPRPPPRLVRNAMRALRWLSLSKEKRIAGPGNAKPRPAGERRAAQANETQAKQPQVKRQRERKTRSIFRPA